jgi:hypothetical protein
MFINCVKFVKKIDNTARRSSKRLSENELEVETKAAASESKNISSILY